MKYVVVEQQGRGSYWHDPSPYLAKLPELLPALPPGARAFAADPQHYDIAAPRCVKDLRPRAIPQQAGVDGELVLRFGWGGLPDHDVLTIHYTGVTGVELTDDDGEPIESADLIELSGYNSLRLDEILPHGSGGCSHELRLTLATVRIVCADLTAQWALPVADDGNERETPHPTAT